MRASLTAATINGNITAAIRNLGLDPAATMEELFELYDRGELKLARSPDKTLLFQTRDLQENEIQNIVDDISAKVQKRLDDFNSFVELIEAGIGPSHALQERFGSA